MTSGHGDVSKASLLSQQELEQSVVITDHSQPDNPMIFISHEFENKLAIARPSCWVRTADFFRVRKLRLARAAFS